MAEYINSIILIFFLNEIISAWQVAKERFHEINIHKKQHVNDDALYICCTYLGMRRANREYRKKPYLLDFNSNAYEVAGTAVYCC